MLDLSNMQTKQANREAHYPVMRCKLNMWNATIKFPRVIALLFEAMKDKKDVKAERALKAQEE